MLNSLNIKQYKPQSTDTSIEADILLFELLKKLSNPEKAGKTCQFNRSIRNIILTSINYQHPKATINEIRAEYIKRCLGKEWIKILNNYLIEKNIMIEDPITLARRIANILESLMIPYLVGGSVASSLWGESRATQDLGIVVDISVAQASALIQAIQTDFYISKSAVLDAINRNSSFNIIHLESIEKADIFVLDKFPFSQSKMNRRQWFMIDAESQQGIYVYSPEDIILQKLRWYSMTQSESQKQWRDVLGVLKVQAGKLDNEYLYRWAKTLQLEILLEEALNQAGLINN